MGIMIKRDWGSDENVGSLKRDEESGAAEPINSVTVDAYGRRLPSGARRYEAAGRAP